MKSAMLCLVFLLAFQGYIDGRTSRTVPSNWLKNIDSDVNRIPAGQTPAGDEPMKIVCYYPWHGKDGLTPDKVDTKYCTHIITGFATVSTSGEVDPGDQIDIYKQVAAFKDKQPDLKTMLSIGGGGGEAGFSDAVSTPQSRSKFIKSILDLLKECNLDGLDVDWEFPSWNSPAKDKVNFALFLQDFRAAVADTDLLLSVAVAAQMPIIFASYDVPALARYTDFINLMTYGFHDYKPLEDPFTGFNSPLFPRSVEKAYFATLNLAWSAEYWVKIGMPRSKIMVGIPTYAHTYVLANATMDWPDAPAVDGGTDWSYSQCCDFIKSGAKTSFDKESLVPYASMDLEWISYENEESITEKAKWVKTNQFGGAMTFGLHSDDWKKSCGSEDFPLHKIIHSIISG